MNQHPRLYVSSEQLAGLKKKATHPALKTAQADAQKAADDAVANPEVVYPHDTHNAHLIRARKTQCRIVSMLVLFFQTGQARYRDAAMRDLRAIGDWEYWSWITWRQNNPDPMAIYDLSYGENSTTLAIAYDWLHDSLTAQEKSWFIETARRRSILPFLKFSNLDEPKGRAWWFFSAQSNWNTVCAGGAGMLALAMHEDLPEASEVLVRVEACVKPYMESMMQIDGAWPEGIGYWNYGMRYAFMYLLSHERATGKQHPLMNLPSTRKTLHFPLDFSPNGVACSFGDVNHFSPLPFHFAAAARFKETALMRDMLARLQNASWNDASWPSSAEALLLVPRNLQDAPRKAAPKSPAKKPGVAGLYRGQDWAFLADRIPGPDFYLSIRGGTTEVPHGHHDLLSFHAVVKDEALITSLGVAEYLDTTFSPRRYELWEAAPPSKNTLLINGVGITGKSRVTTTPVQYTGGFKGFALDAGSCFGEQRDGPVVKACARRFLLLPGAAGVLIVDSITLPHVGRVEARFHTFASMKLTDARVQLTGKRQKLTAAMVCNHPAKLHTAVNAPTKPGVGANMFRWCTDELHEEFLLATLLCPGHRATSLEIEKQGKNAVIVIKGLGKILRLALK